MSTNPAAASVCSYAAFSSAPETHPDHISAVCITSLGRALLSPRKTISETANLPPGLRTRYASLTTRSFLVERLITQFEITDCCSIHLRSVAPRHPLASCGGARDGTGPPLPLGLPP